MTLSPPFARSRLVVADLGNSRMKWGTLGADGSLDGLPPLLVIGGESWLETVRASEPKPGDYWAIASVNPPAAEALGALLARLGVVSVSWYRSARDVPFTPDEPPPRGAGADRALAAIAARSLVPRGEAALLISCGTAITLERIDASGRWEGGAIAAGLGMVARALNAQTAQLPRVDLLDVPPPWGDSTASALAAGIYWGVVGSVRELIRAQDLPDASSRMRIWTGGDAPLLAPEIDGPSPRIIPELVLRGLALAAFGMNFGPVTS